MIRDSLTARRWPRSWSVRDMRLAAISLYGIESVERGDDFDIAAGELR
jgi:hypothetical protein